MGFLLSFLARRLAQGLLIILLVSFGIFPFCGWCQATRFV
jgi:hypothetical protein